MSLSSTIPHNKIASISSKHFLTLMLAAMLLVILPASVAAQSGGVTPTLAVPLADDVNEGSLSPFEQHWFKFTPVGTDVEQPLHLVINPGDDNTINFVSLKVFEGNQIEFFSDGDTADMAVFGSGQIITQDDNPDTGEQFWSGTVSEPTIYYIQILNESDLEINYQLFSTKIEPETTEKPKVVEPAAEDASAPAPITKTSNDPGLAEELIFPEAGRIQGSIAPHSKYWYTFSYPNLGEDRFRDLNYTLFFTPDDGNKKHYVNFELYPYSELALWERGDGDNFTNFGAGMLIDRDGDDATGERLWNGTVIKGDTYIMSISNANDTPVDYWLYEGDIIHPILGPEPPPAPAPVFAEGASPQTAAPLIIGENKGHLEAGEEAWYSFSIANLDEKKFEEMALTMVSTADDGNRLRNMTFDVFTAGGVQNWSPGDNSQINNIGAGSVVVRDDNFLTSERFWQGWVNDGDLYYVQIRNGTGAPMDYHLFTGDVYGAELGEKTPPIPRKPAAPGTAPYAPVELEVGINTGKLEPGKEQWYTFSRADALTGTPVETVFTMVFTPDDGNRRHHVNFELFEGNQLRDWAPDNRFNLVNFGQGSLVERDQSLDTGEFLWHGYVLAGDLYYMRVTNESDAVIEYKIFPEDVINADLGQ